MLNGQLPSDWSIQRLESVAQIRTGLALGRTDVANPVRLPYLRVANVQDGHLKLDEIKHVTVRADEVDRYTLLKGDILLTEGGDFDKLGRGTMWRGEIDPCLHQNHVFVVRTERTKLLPEYLEWLTSSPYGRRYFKKCSKQSTNLASINSSQLKAFPIPLPPLREQRAIAEVLHTWDRGIREAERLLKLKHRFKRGLMQHFLMGRRRFPEFAAQPWRNVRLRDVAEGCSVRNKGTLGRDSVKAVTKASGMIPMKPETIAGSIERYQIVRHDWFAYNPMRLNIGSISRWRGANDVLVSPDYVVFRCKDEELDPGFLDQFRRSHVWTSFMSACGNGSVRVRIWFDDLGVLKLRLPTFPEQQKIAAVLVTADREIELLEQQLAALREQKKGLMQKLLTGQVRLKVPKEKS